MSIGWSLPMTPAAMMRVVREPVACRPSMVCWPRDSLFASLGSFTFKLIIPPGPAAIPAAVSPLVIAASALIFVTPALTVCPSGEGSKKTELGPAGGGMTDLPDGNFTATLFLGSRWYVTPATGSVSVINFGASPLVDQGP